MPKCRSELPIKNAINQKEDNHILKGIINEMNMNNFYSNFNNASTQSNKKSQKIQNFSFQKQDLIERLNINYQNHMDSI